MATLYRLGNDEIAAQLEEASELLRAQDADPWRVRALRDGADAIRSHRDPLVEVFEQRGSDGLMEIPHVGRGIAAMIAQMLERGRSGMLERLRGEVGSERLLQTLPGIGPKLAARVHEELGIDTLEELELAAHDGRLASVRGFGPRRSRAVRDLLAAQLRRGTRERARRKIAPPRAEPPPVELLLTLDRGYREKAAADELPKIAPRRFNPSGEKWLPIWHPTSDGWHFTLMFSNTATAHRLGTTNDWVIVYFERDGREGQSTIVTERRGPLAGHRVVRGREEECLGLMRRSA